MKPTTCLACDQPYHDNPYDCAYADGKHTPEELEASGLAAEKEYRRRRDLRRLLSRKQDRR